MELFKRRPNPSKDEKEIEKGKSALLRLYHGSMRSFAKEILEEARKQFDDYDSDNTREWISDRVHETADGTEWVIYTHRAIQTIEASDNWDAIDDAGALPASVESLSSFFSQIAYYAVAADIERYIEAFKDEFFGS